MASIGKIVLTPKEDQELLMWSRSSKMDYRYVIRSKVILMCAYGKRYKKIMRELKVTRPVISKWKKRFVARRMDGLRDAFRSGKPAVYTEKDSVRVISLACSKPEGGYTQWSQRRIAQKVGG